jgi:hypothetical protein
MLLMSKQKSVFLTSNANIARSNEILGWEGVGNRQLLCFFTAWSVLTANLKFRAKKIFLFSFFAMF